MSTITTHTFFMNSLLSSADSQFLSHNSFQAHVLYQTLFWVCLWDCCPLANSRFLSLKGWLSNSLLEFLLSHVLHPALFGCFKFVVHYCGRLGLIILLEVWRIYIITLKMLYCCYPMKHTCSNPHPLYFYFLGLLKHAQIFFYLNPWGGQKFTVLRVVRFWWIVMPLQSYEHSVGKTLLVKNVKLGTWAVVQVSTGEKKNAHKNHA